MNNVTVEDLYVIDVLEYLAPQLQAIAIRHHNIIHVNAPLPRQIYISNIFTNLYRNDIEKCLSLYNLTTGDASFNKEYKIFNIFFNK